MEKYPKLFVLAAVGYLLVGVLFGLGLGMGHIDAINGRFAHAHLNLLGFMAMFIYGVAYHILPRFNARPVANPGLIPVHFYLVNIGVIGMTGSALFDGVFVSGGANVLFIISSLAESIGIFIFGYNIIPVMLPEPEPVEDATEITENMKVSDVLDEYPGLIDIFTQNGFKALANPAARATFAKAVTIGQACKLHRVDKPAFLGKLNDALKNGTATAAKSAAPAPAAKPASGAPTPPKPTGKGKKIERGQLCEVETLVGSLIEVYPETKVVFTKHYGEGCFSCPGQAFETVGQTAMMHGIKAETILDEINDIIKSTQN